MLEQIDFYWSLRAGNITIDKISKDLDKIMMRKLLIKPKRKNAKIYDFKEFKIKQIIKSDPDKFLHSVKMIDAIIGPNFIGF